MDRNHPEYAEALRFLYDRLNYEKAVDRPYNQQNYRLARMEGLLHRLGNPQRQAPVIHIAGTKGKGSVAWLAAESLRRSGYRVGLYTSPHLQFLEERFVVDGQPISPEQLVRSIGSIREAVQETTDSSLGAPTFFEMTTAIAWELFATLPTDVNVIEVGLGGRLDSTNVCQSLIAVITSISLDHQAQLGNTIAKIAGEKAGIIKPESFVIHGARHPDAREVIRERARTKGCRVWELGREFDCEVTSHRVAPGTKKRIRFQVDNSIAGLHSMDDLHLKMLGDHQADNAALAIAAMQKLISLGWNVTEDAIRDALRTTQVNSRIEVVCERPTVIVDTAHNVASMGSLLQTLRDHFLPKRKTVVYASSKDKDFEAMLHRIMGYADRIILTQYRSNPRFVPVEKLEKLARSYQSQFPEVQVLAAPDPDIAKSYALMQSADDDLICFTGSFFLAAEIRPLF